MQSFCTGRRTTRRGTARLRAVREVASFALTTGPTPSDVTGASGDLTVQRGMRRLSTTRSRLGGMLPLQPAVYLNGGVGDRGVGTSDVEAGPVPTAAGNGVNTSTARII